ncbi:MAG: hypothetical protein NUV34_07490 [Sulfuricaulis sp.]|nr:hypothetical protein [Sulfuricaulis sp.]
MTNEEVPVLFDVLGTPADFMPRECTPAELERLVKLHDSILAEKPDPDAGACVDPQLIHPAVSPGEAGAAIAWLISPIDFHLTGNPCRLVAALYCAGHEPGEPLADAIKLGRAVSACVFLDSEPNDSLWGQAPLYPVTSKEHST